jgi:REP element-mobilizing transposase RayT
LKYHRRSIRLREYAYTQVGAYFLTMCTFKKAPLFGKLQDGKMLLSPLGFIVEDCWTEIPNHFARVELDLYVIMPNHFHGIVVLQESPGRGTACRALAAEELGGLVCGEGTACRAPTAEQFGRPVPESVPTIVRSFKSAATKRANASLGTPGAALWQRNYFEHVIRDTQSLNRIREYIATNPAKWESDHDNPKGTGVDEFYLWLTSM